MILGKAMDFVRWTKQLAIGIPFVDADHRILVSLINQADACIAQREETATLGGVLATLGDYTEYHFQREERMLEVAGYEDLSGHRDKHLELVRDVRRIDERFRKDPVSVSAREVRDFLKSWLVEHIVGHDFAYRETCVGNAEASQAALGMRFMEDRRAAFGVTEWNGLSVMVVDDNRNFLKLVETILKALGIRRVRLETDPARALDQLLRRPADLVLCDWLMDGMNGAEFARQVALMELPTEVVMLTAYSIDELKGRTSSGDIDNYLAKPITAESLLGTLAKVSAY